MLSNAWQLGVVDYDRFMKRLSMLGHDKAMKLLKNEMQAGELKNGTVVYVIDVEHNAKCEYGELTHYDRAHIWLPENQSYGDACIQIIRPVLTEKDAVQAELDFCISLADYVK